MSMAVASIVHSVTMDNSLTVPMNTNESTFKIVSSLPSKWSNIVRNKRSSQQYFKVQPEDRQVIEGTDSIELECHVGNLMGQVQWSKDDFLLGEFHILFHLTLSSSFLFFFFLHVTTVLLTDHLTTL